MFGSMTPGVATTRQRQKEPSPRSATEEQESEAWRTPTEEAVTWVRPWYADDAVVLNSQSVASEAASVPCNYADVTIVGASPRGHATRWERLRVQCDCSRFITEVLLARRSPSTTDPSARHLGHSARRGDVTHMQHSATLRSTSASTKGKASSTRATLRRQDPGRSSHRNQHVARFCY